MIVPRVISPAVTAIGLIAAVCTTVSFVPQLIRVWRLRSAREISLTMFLVFSLGTFLWLLYGILIRSLPVILANAVTLFADSHAGRCGQAGAWHLPETGGDPQSGARRAGLSILTTISAIRLNQPDLMC